MMNDYINDNMINIGDTLDVIFIYPNGLSEPTSFTLYDFNYSEDIPTHAISIQSPLGKALYQRKVLETVEVKETGLKIFIQAKYKLNENINFPKL